MLEQLKMLCQMLSGMAGTGSEAELRATIVAQNDETDDEGKPIPYENLSPRDKAGVDEAVAAMMQLSKVFDTAIEARATMCYKFYKSLQKAGFSEPQALQIVASQGVDMVKSS